MDNSPASVSPSRALRAGNVRRLPSEVDLLALHAADPGRYPFLLQSTARGGPNARYDILFAFPGRALLLEPGAPARGGAFLDQLDAWWREEQQVADPDQQELPFRGGWFVFLGYELAGQIEPRLVLPAAEGELPVAAAVRVPAAVIRDHSVGGTYLVAEADAPELLDAMEADVARIKPSGDVEVQGLQLLEEDPARYLEAVRRAKRYIVDGDVFQVNLSRAWSGRAARPLSAAGIYRRLCQSNPAPFAGLARFDRGAILSSSPERLVRVRGRRVDTRPIAGTRPRAPEAAPDRALLAELIGHPKERAEHIMLLDLERNDLGRICEPGSVAVNEMMVLESFAHVHHIVSNVEGRLRAGVTPGQVLRAVFPGGTITGCPKVRCMEIIAELEQTGRGAYTGAMGYLNHDGSMDMNILIRTITLSDKGASVRAGAGIVADSVPQRELEETRAKARGMLLALTGRA